MHTIGNHLSRNQLAYWFYVCQLSAMHHLEPYSDSIVIVDINGDK